MDGVYSLLYSSSQKKKKHANDIQSLLYTECSCTRTTSVLSVWIVSMVIDFRFSVDLVAVGGFMAVCLCLDGSSSVFSAHEMQLLSSTGDVNAAF